MSERRQQSKGCQDHRDQKHQSHCICHAFDYPTFAARSTVAVMTTMENILPNGYRRRPATTSCTMRRAS